MNWTMKTKALLVVVGVLHLAVLFAGFLSPYDPAQQNRDFPYAPPTQVHFRDANGAFHLRPQVCQLSVQPGSYDTYIEDRSQCASLELFVKGPKYTALGLFQTHWHLFGINPTANQQFQIFLLGTDSLGRDVFSRLLFGSQISLFAGLLATALTLLLGLLLGILAGYYGGWLDAIVMRGGELFLALPWLYLLFALRAFLPLHVSPNRVFLLLIAVIGMVGWARPARLIRGIVLSSKERGYVLAAKTFGASDLYVIHRHILPDTWGIVLTQAALLVPQFILAEVTLSFLGLGVAEPSPSWGNMLATLQQYQVMVSYWWMWAPGFVLVPVFLSYTFLAGALQDQGGL